MSLRVWIPVLAGLLACSVRAADEPAEEAQRRERLAAERAAAQSRYDAALRECQSAFAVTGCVDRADYCAGWTLGGPGTCTPSASNGYRCTWDALNSRCKEVVPYQIPLFFADNITDGSAVTQYGDGLATACESFTQKLSKFDFLWTIDDSGSMSQEINEVRDGAVFVDESRLTPITDDFDPVLASKPGSPIRRPVRRRPRAAASVPG